MGCGCGRKTSIPTAPRTAKTAPKASGNTPKKVRRVIKRSIKK